LLNQFVVHRKSPTVFGTPRLQGHIFARRFGATINMPAIGNPALVTRFHDGINPAIDASAGNFLSLFNRAIRGPLPSAAFVLDRTLMRKGQAAWGYNAVLTTFSAIGKVFFAAVLSASILCFAVSVAHVAVTLRAAPLACVSVHLQVVAINMQRRTSSRSAPLHFRHVLRVLLLRRIQRNGNSMRAGWRRRFATGYYRDVQSHHHIQESWRLFSVIDN
jgi:hypothetical protein